MIGETDNDRQWAADDRDRLWDARPRSGGEVRTEMSDEIKRYGWRITVDSNEFPPRKIAGLVEKDDGDFMLFSHHQKALAACEQTIAEQAQQLENQAQTIRAQSAAINLLQGNRMFSEQAKRIATLTAELAQAKERDRTNVFDDRPTCDVCHRPMALGGTENYWECFNPACPGRKQKAHAAEPLPQFKDITGLLAEEPMPTDIDPADIAEGQRLAALTQESYRRWRERVEGQEGQVTA